MTEEPEIPGPGLPKPSNKEPIKRVSDVPAVIRQSGDRDGDRAGMSGSLAGHAPASNRESSPCDGSPAGRDINLPSVS